MLFVDKQISVEHVIHAFERVFLYGKLFFQDSAIQYSMSYVA